LSLEDFPGNRSEGDLRFIAGHHHAQLVLLKQGDDLVVILDKTHGGDLKERRGNRTGPQLKIDHHPVAWRDNGGLRQVPPCARKLRADLCDFGLIVIHRRTQYRSNLGFLSPRSG
jgi:hypothetical protein